MSGAEPEPAADPGKPLDRRAVLIRNEQIKARVGLLNSLAGTCLTAGAVTPFGLLMFGTLPAGHHWLPWIAGIATLVCLGFRSHLVAIQVLEGLRDA